MYNKKQNFTLTLDISLECITLTLRELNSYKQWISSMDNTSIVNLTSKMGNQKDFQTFCKMLISSLDNKTPDLHYDILTASQIDTLRNANKSSIIKEKDNLSCGILNSTIEQIDQ